MDQEQREQGTLLLAAERERRSPDLDLEGAEETERDLSRRTRSAGHVPKTQFNHELGGGTRTCHGNEAGWSTADV
jgi:hypothetical protein